MKRSGKGVGVFKTEQERNFRTRHSGTAQIMYRERLPYLVEDLLKRGAFILQFALQRPGADCQLATDRLH